MNHEMLKENYPEIITMEQFYQIANISKRKARFILENGILPCKDSGKKTRRFKIRLTDVIEFLEKRDSGLLDKPIPVGIFSSGCNREDVSTFAINREDFKNYLTEQWSEYAEMIPVNEVEFLIGYVANTVNKWVSVNQSTP